MNEECFLDDDGGPEVQAVEAMDLSGHRQSLGIRVGPVFRGSHKPAPEPGIWVEYQREHGLCIPDGPVLLTPRVWRELNAVVESRLRRYGRRRRLPWRR